MLSASVRRAVSLAPRCRAVGGRGGTAGTVAAWLAMCLLAGAAAADTAPTPAGSDIAVTVGGCRVTFTQVTAAGLTSANTPASAPALAAPDSPIGPVYDVKTTAGHTGPVTVALRCYDPSAFSGGGAQLALLSYDPSAAVWKDVTVSRDAASGLVSGHANALGLLRLAVTPSLVPIQGTMWVQTCCPGPWPGSLFALSGDSSQREPLLVRFSGNRFLDVTPDGKRVAYNTGWEQIRAARGAINLAYMAHLQDDGDTGWVYLDTFIGTNGRAKRLEGFAIQVTPEYADKYDAFYMAHLEGTGDTPWHSNGEFCGTRGQRRRVEAIAVFVAEKEAG